MLLIDKINVTGKFLVIFGSSYLLLTQYQTQIHECIHVLNSSSFTGGFLSGSLHALTGPDHIAILLPLIFNKYWYKSCIYGIVWGFGHGVASAVIGFLSFVMKSYVVNLSDFFSHSRHLLDCVVGVTLVVIGVMGIMEQSGGDDNENDEMNQISGYGVSASEGGATDLEKCIEYHHPSSPSHSEADSSSGSSISNSYQASPQTSSPTSLASTSVSANTNTTSSSSSLLAYGALFVNGSLLGVSWDGLPSLAPSIVMDAYQPLILFLVAYLAGTALMMGLAAGAVGEATCLITRLHSSSNGGDYEAKKQPHISERLAYMSSLTSIAIGTLWIVFSAGKYLLNTYFSDVTAPGALNDNTVGDNDGVLMDNNDNSLLFFDKSESGRGSFMFGWLISADQHIHHQHDHPHHHHSHIKLLLSAGSIVVILAVIFHTIAKEYGLVGVTATSSEEDYYENGENSDSSTVNTSNSYVTIMHNVWSRLKLAVRSVLHGSVGIISQQFIGSQQWKNKAHTV